MQGRVPISIVFSSETDGKGTCYDRLANSVGANDEQRDFREKYILSVEAKQSEGDGWYPDITLVKDGVLVPQPETTSS